MKTIHTKIDKGEVKFNSPVSYDIKSKEGKIINTINIQKGPVKEEGLNGVFLEDLIMICLDQVEHFQNSEYACIENEDTQRHLRDALNSTRARQYKRVLDGTQGTSKI